MASQSEEPRRGPGTPTAAGALSIRAPLQRRSQDAWNRVLNAGLELLESGGYAAVTIAAVCERANVAPRAIYDRADSKDALFLAIYEHGMRRVREDNARFSDGARWHDLAAPQLIDQAVRDLAEVFARQAAFLRAVVLISGQHTEISRRGAFYIHELAGQFTTLLLHIEAHIDQPDPRTATSAVFNAVFSTLVLRTAEGPGFVTPADSDETLLSALSTMAQRYLLPPEIVPAPPA